MASSPCSATGATPVSAANAALPGYELKPGGNKHQHTIYLWRVKRGLSR
ncbi:MAG TPA: hypothetical protein VH985_06280 [Candidatus Binatia bacterium]|jgi:hypothetical protein